MNRRKLFQGLFAAGLTALLGRFVPERFAPDDVRVHRWLWDGRAEKALQLQLKQLPPWSVEHQQIEKLILDCLGRSENDPKSLAAINRL